MPVAGLGLHFIVAVFFAIHAIRSGRETYWLFILFMFPLMGSIVYFLAVYLPDSRMQHGVRNFVNAAGNVLDPGRELREAKEAYELTATAQNKVRLAKALLVAGNSHEAAELYQSCLRGPLSDDPELRFGAARAFLEDKRLAPAMELLGLLQQQSPSFRPEQVARQVARAYDLAGEKNKAQQQFNDNVERFGTIESRVDLIVWLTENGFRQEGEHHYQDLAQTMKRWNKHTRSLNKENIDRLKIHFRSV